MNPNLLNDILRESDYPDFRAQLLFRIQAEARRKRRARLTAALALAASLTLLAGTLFLHRAERQIAPIVAAKVETVPVLKRIPLKDSQLLQTRSTAHIAFSTDHKRHPRAITDNELLALFPRTPIGLAATPNGKRLIFAEPAHARFFMSSN